MRQNKFLNITLCGILCSVLASGRALAERDCTHTTVSENQGKDITVDCTATYSQTSDSFTDHYLYNTLEQNLQNALHWNSQSDHAQDQTKDTSQQSSSQDQQARLQDLKDRQQDQQEAQQEQQQSRQDAETPNL